VDHQAFRNETYKRLIGGSLDGVLDSIRRLQGKGLWLEITTLVVHGMNDSAELVMKNVEVGMLPYGFSMRISTRRFSWRPADVVLDAS